MSIILDGSEQNFSETLKTLHAQTMYQLHKHSNSMDWLKKMHAVTLMMFLFPTVNLIGEPLNSLY